MGVGKDTRSMPMMMKGDVGVARKATVICRSPG